MITIVEAQVVSLILAIIRTISLCKVAPMAAQMEVAFSHNALTILTKHATAVTLTGMTHATTGRSLIKIANLAAQVGTVHRLSVLPGLAVTHRLAHSGHQAIYAILLMAQQNMA